eukprot:m.243850 g.243850  ORF g.243850 m.243850 type:complete len:207 (+) comp14335_c0_seq1:90-710(+)
MKLGVVYLGVLFGKHKYTVVEDEDVEFCKACSLKVSLEVDKNGMGSQVIVIAHLGQDHAIRLNFHDALWIRRRGPIPAGYVVAHINGLTLDNRFSNLNLVLKTKVTAPLTSEEKIIRLESAQVYKLALSQMRPNPAALKELTARPIFHECRHKVCANLETVGCEFAPCPKCRAARYCSAECRELDSADHLADCQLVAATHIELIQR